MKRWTRRIFLCLGLLGAGAALAQGVGTVIAIGGALRDDNDAVWGRIVQAAGGPGARIVVISEASQDPERSAAVNIALLERRGANAERLRPGDIAAVQAAGGVFFTGGDQSLIVKALQGTPLLAAIRELLERGGVVAGSSAGAAVMSETMFTGGAPFEVMSGAAGRITAPGLAFVKSGVIVDQHFLKRGRIGRLLPTLVREKIPLGLGVEEDSAAVIRGDEVEVIGARGVLVVDVAEARSNAAQPHFNVQGALLHYLDRGDRLDLASRRITPSAAKLATRHVDAKNPAWRPYFQGAPFFPDLLADFAIVSAMTRLVDSREGELRGLAFDPRSELGFHWRLHRSADTSGWSVGDQYTLSGVHVDVQPVRMARPLFTPWK